jgi:hypothetical protein
LFLVGEDRRPAEVVGHRAHVVGPRREVEQGKLHVLDLLLRVLEQGGLLGLADLLGQLAAGAGWLLGRFLVAICCVLRSAVTPLTFSAKVLTTVRGSGGRPIVRASSADSAAIRSERATAALGGGGGGSGAAGPSGSSKREPAGRNAPPAVPACALRSAA